MDGILVIHKEAGMTSRDVVDFVSKKYGVKKIGHTGTLDPLATGVLVLCLGKATKLVEVLTSFEKEYQAGVLFGVETDTLDITGTVLKKESCLVDNDLVDQAIFDFPKIYLQEVPLYSAVKVNGKKCYEYARKKEEVLLPKKEVRIKSLKRVSDVIENRVSILTTVSKGTYIRSLIRDLTFSMNMIATMESLVRIKQGNFTLEDAIFLKDLGEKPCLHSIYDCLKHYPSIVVKKELEKKIRNGCKIIWDKTDDVILFLDENKTPLALYKTDQMDENLKRPYKMLC